MTTVQRLSKSVSDQEAEKFADEIYKKLIYTRGKTPDDAVEIDWLQAVSLAIRDRIVDRWLTSDEQAKAESKKHVHYLSIEFLVGRMLFDALTNLRMQETAQKALATFNVDLDLLRKLEPDAALGNGGLGRLAACYMDSMSALGIPAYGYGIRYEQGLFRQQFKDGRQIELPDDWLAFGNPWEFSRPEIEYSIRFGGTVEYGARALGIWNAGIASHGVRKSRPWRSKTRSSK